MFKGLGNEGTGMAAFDSDFFADDIETFVDVWLNKNVDINDPNAVAAEKERLRTSDLETIKGRDGMTFQKAYENYIVGKFQTIHSDFYQRKRIEGDGGSFKPDSVVYNVLAGKGVKLGAQVNTANQIASKSGDVIQSYDNVSYYQWDSGREKFKKVTPTTDGDDKVTWHDESYVMNREFQNNPQVLKWVTGASTTTTVDKSEQLLNKLGGGSEEADLSTISTEELNKKMRDRTATDAEKQEWTRRVFMQGE